MSKEKHAKFDCDYNHRANLTAAQWVDSANALSMLDFLAGRRGAARRRRYLSLEQCEQKLRHLMLACCQRIRPYSRDRRTLEALETAELFLDQQATAGDLCAAHGLAQTAYDVAGNRGEVCAAFPAICATLPQLTFDSCQYAVDLAAYATAFLPPDKWDDSLRNTSLELFAGYVRDIFGNPFRANEMHFVSSPEAMRIADHIYKNLDFREIGTLGKALQRCENPNHLAIEHCQSDSEHVRGCWVVDMARRLGPA